jgi:DNA-binding MarR family transcriptional regulator
VYLDDILELDRILRRRLRQGGAESWLQVDLPLGSVRALLMIDSEGETTPGAIARALDISRTTLTGLLDRLEAEGFIVRSLNPADRRSFTLTATERGRTLAYQVDGHRRELLARALSHMAPRDLQALRDGLTALLEALDAEQSPAGTAAATAVGDQQ